MARKMKDSGIEWIGKIPEGWEVSQLKYATRWKSEKGCPDAPVLSLYRDFGVVPKDSRDDNHNVTSLDTSNYKVVDIGDLVINKMKAWQGSMAVSDYRGIVSPAYHVCSITSNKVNKRYLHHLLRNPAYLPEYARLSTGMRIGQWDLGFDDFKNIPFLIPPLDEQAKIADYLDNGCASLDVILDKTRFSIEEYKKLKQAVITQAVTKGVRGEREMKDSGIEWIGEINHRFSLIKLKYICSILDQYRKPISADKRSQSGSILYDYYGASGAIDKIDDYTIDDHVMLIGEDGANLRMRNLPLMYEVNGKAWINNHAHILKPTERVDFYYLFYALEELDINPYITGSAQPKLSQEKLQNIWVPLPDLEEQQEIATYIRSKCAEIDGLVAKKEQLVKELESYKKSLIYEVVTGKREV